MWMLQPTTKQCKMNWINPLLSQRMKYLGRNMMSKLEVGGKMRLRWGRLRRREVGRNMRWWIVVGNLNRLVVVLITHPIMMLNQGWVIIVLHYSKTNSTTQVVIITWITSHNTSNQQKVMMMTKKINLWKS